MKEPYYHIELDDNEHSAVIKSLKKLCHLCDLIIHYRFCRNHYRFCHNDYLILDLCYYNFVLRHYCICTI